MALPTGCRRLGDYCSLDNRCSIDSSGDENIRSSGGVGEAACWVSTLQNEQCMVSNPETGSGDKTEISIVNSLAGL
jgi:hypothetical protein